VTGGQHRHCDREDDDFVVFRRSPRGYCQGYNPWSRDRRRGGTSLVIRIGD
jgi:hypothetical protein